MRRKITLYIDGKQADISDQSFLLFNYAFTDIEKPTAVKNSYSKQITLPGTPANDAIFSHIYKLDRETAAGTFNALKRTPFVIYDDLGQILESGYLKLDKVLRNKVAKRSYTVTLYGGLGSFFYGLMYDEGGNQRKLSDMNYAYKLPDDTLVTDINLDRTINAGKIFTAWNRIDQYYDSPNWVKHNVLNFIPCYNGKHDGFDSNKVLFYDGSWPTIPHSITDADGNTFYPHNGWSLITLPKEYTEWQVRDLRSYYQRPCLNIQAFLDSVSLPENNGGYEIDWKVRPPYQRNLWLTLKRPVDTEVSGGSQTETYTDQLGTEILSPRDFKSVTEFPLSAGSNGTTAISLTLKPQLGISGTPPTSPGGYLFEAFDRYKRGSTTNLETACAATFIQVVGYDSAGNVKCHSSIYAFTNATNRKTLNEVVNDAFTDTTKFGDVTPPSEWDFFIEDDLVAVNGKYIRQGNTGIYAWDSPVTLSITGERLASFKVLLFRTSDEIQQDAGAYGYYRPTTWNITAGTASRRQGYDGYIRALFSGTAVTTITSARSFVDVTKDEFLNSEHSIGEYLLSLGKLYGWLFTCDEVAKKVTVWDRNSFFNTSGVLDLTDRIDRSKDITITPLLAQSRIYSFGGEPIGGKAATYAERYARRYGTMRANTGYEFNDKEVDVTDGLAFKTPVFMAAKGKEYTWPYVGSTEHMNFEEDGFEITMGDPHVEGGAGTVSIAPLHVTLWDSYTNKLNFSDPLPKPQFEDAEQKAAAGEDCLVYLRPRSEWGNPDGSNLPNYLLSDDNDEMYYQNGDKPCWLFAWVPAGQTYPDGSYGWYGLNTIPRFMPYIYDDDDLQLWLYFGIPSELYDPYITQIDENGTLYARYWANYIRDRYDKDTKVLKCRVNLEGLQVGPELLRRFFWYENSLWVLNKITNYSLTTYDTAECEFVQVRDKSNYTNGQTW